jgi:hypothetical protein
MDITKVGNKANFPIRTNFVEHVPKNMRAAKLPYESRAPHKTTRARA